MSDTDQNILDDDSVVEMEVVNDESGEVTGTVEVGAETEEPEAESTDKPEEGSEAEETDESGEGEAEAEPEAQEEEEEAPEEDTTNSEEAESDEEVDPKERARQEYKARQEAKKLAESAIDSQYRTSTEKELIDQGLEPAQAQVEILKQQRQLDNFRHEVSELNATMQSEAMMVLNQFPVFDPNSKDFDSDYAQEVEQMYQQYAQVQYNNPQSQDYIVSANAPPYEFYSWANKNYQKSLNKGKAAGQKAAVQQISSIEPKGIKTPPEVKKDPIEQIWDDDEV